MDGAGSNSQPEISKKQRKKERKRQIFLSKRKEKRLAERAKKKAKRHNARLRGEELKPKRGNRRLMQDSKCSQKVAIDMSFEHLMSQKDLQKLFVQLAHCYATNRRAANPLQLSFVHFTGNSLKAFQNIETNNNWDVIIDKRDLHEAFDKENIVYLTADSDNVLDVLDSSKVYVIGGLLDHNMFKSCCLNHAKGKGISHARLPIDEYVNLKTRKVLTVNQVFEILVRYTESRSWKDSFFAVIPKRKGMESREEEGPPKKRPKTVEASSSNPESHAICEATASSFMKLEVENCLKSLIDAVSDEFYHILGNSS